MIDFIRLFVTVWQSHGFDLASAWSTPTTGSDALAVGPNVRICRPLIANTVFTAG
jgi:hypothetical protein